MHEPPPPPPHDDFYIGYVDRAPRSLARFVRRSIALLAAFGAGAALLAAAGQQRFDVATFEYGHTTNVAGRITAAPYPALLVQRPGAEASDHPMSRYHLVARGKHGADQLVHELDGRSVDAAGTLIYRDDQTMIEIGPAAVVPNTRPAGGGVTLRRPDVLGTVTLQGEIVDSKCFLGVMNPATWTPHRACAVRCVSGGVPPMLVVRDANGVAAYVLLADAQGRPSGSTLLDLIAEPVEVRGRLERHDGQLFLFADRSSYRRLP